VREKCGLSTNWNICNAEFKTNGGSTEALHEYMKRAYGVTLLKRKTEDDSIENVAVAFVNNTLKGSSRADEQISAGKYIVYT